jgi:hypothetical protein
LFKRSYNSSALSERGCLVATETRNLVTLNLGGAEMWL